MSRIKRPRRSIVDVTTIWTYIAEHNFPAGEASVEKVDATLRLLAANPFMGEAVDHLRAGVGVLRWAIICSTSSPSMVGFDSCGVLHAARKLDDLFE